MSKKARAAPLADNKHVQEFLSIMKANNLSGTEDLSAVIKQVGAMERQLGAAVEELHAMRRELETMREKNHPLLKTVQNAVIIMQNNALHLRDNLAALKKNIIDGCKNAVAAFQEKGLSALRNVADFFKIRPGLETLRDSMDKSIWSDEAAVAKIEAVSAEYHEAGRHLKNMGRTLVGKEAIAEAKAPGRLADVVPDASASPSFELRAMEAKPALSRACAPVSSSP